MSVAEWALLASVVFSGLWSGLLAMLTLVMHPMLARMDGYEFARFLGRSYLWRATRPSTTSPWRAWWSRP